MIENLCGEWQGEKVMREIEKALLEQKRMVLQTRSGLDTGRHQASDSVSVPASPVKATPRADLGVMATQVAGRDVQ